MLKIDPFEIKFLTRVRDMPKFLGNESVIFFSNLPILFFNLIFKILIFFNSEETMKRKPFNRENNSQLKLSLLKILVYILTIVMITGMIIIVFIIFKEFSLKPKNKEIKVDFPNIIKIPKNAILESFSYNKDTIFLIVNLLNGTQKVIVIDFEDGVEKSREYINIENIN